MDQSIDIVVADAHFLSRLGLKQLLSDKDNLTIVGEVLNEKELFELMSRKKPKVIIMDYNQPGNFSNNTITAILSEKPSPNILVITNDQDKNSIDKVLESGVNSFLTKNCGEQEILDAIVATSRGERFFCAKILDHLLEKSYAKTVDKPATKVPLTPREIEIVGLVSKGLVAKEIADKLHLSTHTVYTHRKNIMKKLGLNTSSELVLYALNNGIIKE